ncbi:MAG: hypothetical protein C5B49_10230 [Bdellovibrio sp.]|nr:MAG: hypothetical protein C5B49_10230 [Bdellovibrio sp.]
MNIAGDQIEHCGGADGAAYGGGGRKGTDLDTKGRLSLAKKVAPDIVTAELKKTFEWTTHHTRIVSIVGGTAIVLGVAYSLWNSMGIKKEKALQSQYFELEAQVLKKRTEYEKARNQPARPDSPDPKESKGAKAKEAKSDKAKEPKSAQATGSVGGAAQVGAAGTSAGATGSVGGEAATGNLLKDYGDLPNQLKQFAQQNANSKAGAMAALLFANLMSEYHQPGEAVPVLKDVRTTGLLSQLGQMELGTLLANDGKCDEAIGIFDRLANDPKSAFLKLEAKFKTGLCWQSKGDVAKAEEILNQVVVEGKENSVARSAKKYLRLFRLRKTEEVKAN